MNKLLLSAALALVLGAPLAAAQPPEARRALADADAARGAAMAELDRARQELASAARKLAELSAGQGRDGDLEFLRFVGDPDRAMIGVVLDSLEDGRAQIGGLTPGGPAEQAGMRVGDVLVAVNGRAIAVDGQPRRAARRALSGFRDGEQVSVQVERDGRSLELKVTAKRRDLASVLSQPFTFTVPVPNADHINREVRRAMRNMDSIRWEFNGGADLELASLNPQLGRYFGAEQGVLVLNRYGDDYAGLQPGDVIVEVDGKAVGSPRAALAAIGEHDAGDSFEVNIVRDRGRATVRLTGSDNRMKWRLYGAPPAPPAPPPPPAMPPPPAPPAPPIAAMPALPPVPPLPPPVPAEDETF